MFVQKLEHIYSAAKLYCSLVVTSYDLNISETKITDDQNKNLDDYVKNKQ